MYGQFTARQRNKHKAIGAWRRHRGKVGQKWVEHDETIVGTRYVILKRAGVFLARWDIKRRRLLFV